MSQGGMSVMKNKSRVMDYANQQFLLKGGTRCVRLCVGDNMRWTIVPPCLF
jgi:hypothetical protein